MSEWKEYRIKDICLSIGSGTTPKSTNEKFYKAGQHYWVNTGDLNNGIVSDSRQKITDLALKECSALHFYPEGTVIEAMYGATIGKVGLLNMKATVNQACCALVINKKIALPKFVLNYLFNYKPLLIKESFGGTQPNVNQTKVATIKIALPSLSEQQRIVDYLDEKTNAIDARISVLEKKSDAYTRLKASVINRAVTRGLNPNVSLKDSGIEWCPYIPYDWKVVRVKNLARLQSGSNLTANDIDENGDYPVYGGNGLRGFTNSYTNVGLHVLIGRQGALCGNINYASGKFYATEHAVVVYPYDKDLNTKWFGETMRCANFNRLSASAAQPGLAVSVINNQFIPLPPLSEQQSIATYLDTKCSEIDKAIDNIGKQIEALKRLKRSLINEVVTGKRKV